MDVEIISRNPSPKLSDLNNKVIQKLYDLVDSLDAKSDPDMVQIEFWVDVPAYEQEYQVSNMGNVRSKNWKQTGRTQNIKIAIHDGYPIVHLYKNGIDKVERVHRLVALAFIPNPENKPHINHKNGDRWDNRLENLEWCTNSENMLHKYNVLKYKNRGSISVICVETGEYYWSQSEAVRRFGRKSWQGGSIRKAIKNNETAFGFHWRYATEEESNGQ